MIVGVDEAGRGPLAGPVAACALHLDVQPPFKPQDSKQLSAKKREIYYHWLLENSSFAIAFATHKEIDRLNILKATFLAMDRAVISLINKNKSFKKATFIIDGNRYNTSLKIKYKCLVKADKTVPQVSCASIMAKVIRDAFMISLNRRYPQWNFPKHKGYPTALHYQLIEKHGLSPVHRKTFRLK